MRIARLLTVTEIAALLFAAIFPSVFVSYSAAFLQWLFLLAESPIAYAYAVLVTGMCAVASAWRQRSSGSQSPVRGRGAFLMYCVIFTGSLLMIGSAVLTAPSQISISDVVSPYPSYLLSLFFFVGVGYAIADMFVKLLSKD